MKIKGLEVKAITKKEYEPFIMQKHYAQRMPSISYAYGLYEKDKLIGILTIGKPASPNLCVGVCGEKYRSSVYELNRLCLDKTYNDNRLSWFVGKCLRSLKDDNLILVSYADTGMNHNGYIYQATNWTYTGATARRTDKYTAGNKHSRHYSNENQHLRKVRTSKHRYIYFTGKGAIAKDQKSNLNYQIKPYPKGKNERYKLGDRMKTKVINKETGKTRLV